MRRLLVLCGADIRFQFRYGFFALYGFISLLYIMVLRVLPESWRAVSRLAVVYSDPAALGLFFMGAILLYEKSGRVHPSLAVSPVKPIEYIAAKAFSLALVSMGSALCIQLFSGGIITPAFIYGITAASMLFTLTGICLGSEIKSLNGFLLITIPAELVLMLPPVLYLVLGRPWWLLFHPGVLALDLLTPQASYPALKALFLTLYLVATALLAVRRVRSMMLNGDAGEVSL